MWYLIVLIPDLCAFLTFQKNEYFFNDEDFVDIFGGHHKNGLVLRVISMHFRVLQNGDTFVVVKISNIFGRMPDIPDFFLGGGEVAGKQKMLGPSLRMKKK